MKVKVLKGFDALPDALRNREQSAPEYATAEHLPRAETEVRQQLFADAVGPVTPLAGPGRAESTRPKPKPKRRPGKAQRCTVSRPVSSARTGAAPSRCTHHTDVSWHRPDVGHDVITKLRRSEWDIEDKIDLHGQTRDEARRELTKFVRSAVSSGQRCVLVVHGKGHGSPDGQSVLQANMPCWLKKRDGVMAFTQAPECQGGTGALIVLLRRETSRSPPIAAQ